MTGDGDILKNLYRKMFFVRRFEEKTAEMYKAGKIGGYCHLYVGEEAVAVGALSVIRNDDYCIGAYRDHAHAILKGCDPGRVMAELMGKATGVSKGKGGSMHMFDRAHRFFGGDGIVAGELPIAAGLAFAVQYRGGDQVVMCFFGDGAVNEGAFHEALNLSSLWSLPVVFVCENNQYGMGTPVSTASCDIDLSTRAEGYNIRIDKTDGMDVLAVREVCARSVDYTRTSRRPSFIEAVTYRFVGHSMTDPQVYRTKEEIDQWRERDPIPALAAAMTGRVPGVEAELADIRQQVEAEIEEIAKFADESPDPDPGDLLADVLSAAAEQEE